jgi:FAD/FMN-containing dehydrogenase
MSSHVSQIRAFMKGEARDDAETLKKYSRDTSLFEVKPRVVVFPKDVDDVRKLVTYVSERKDEDSSLSITARSAGTDMTGGPLNDSIIMDMTAGFTKRQVDSVALTAMVEPGVYYRDFETSITPFNLTLPAYPASKTIAALGGMIMNNCAGEKTLRYGQMRRFVDEVSVVLADGNEYTFKETSMTEAKAKATQRDFEGLVYKGMLELVTRNHDLITKAKPHVSKNSSGYALWEIYDAERQTFNLAQLFVGSQGTLGVMTKAKVRLVRDKPHQRLVALFFKDWRELPDVVNAILPLGPESMEAFDDATMTLGIRFMPEVAKKAKESFWRFALRFLPEVFIGIRMMRMPKLVVLVQVAEEDEKTAARKIDEVMAAMKRGKFKAIARVSPSKADADKYWTMRRESFNLLRQHVKGKRTAPFVEDFCVEPSRVPEFLPKAVALLKRHGIGVNITGHAGNGNFHIIPLMDLSKESEREKIPVVADAFYKLVIEHGGTITAEHNDGILRTPYVKQMFGADVYRLFEETKRIFDPLDIFNPGKKVGGTAEYMREHIASS